MRGFQLKRLDMLMEPKPNNLYEAGGILNPAAARGPNGKRHLLPSLVGKHDYSRFGIASVTVTPQIPMAPFPRVDAPNTIMLVVPKIAEATK